MSDAVIVQLGTERDTVNISACFHRYGPMSIFCPFYAVMILASLFSDELVSSLQTRRRPVRFEPSIFTLSCLLHGYDMPYFFLAEVLYTGYIFSSAFPTALLLL